MFKKLGNILYKTPWWAIFLGGLFVFLLLALFTIPFNVISLSNTGANTVEQRAIQREVDRSFGDSALNIAERVVKAASERTEDQTRKAELKQALKDIEAAREEMNSAASEVDRARAEASAAASEIRREAKRAATDAARQARNDAKDEARKTRDDAREKLTSLREARAEAMRAQKRVGLDDASALAIFDNAIKEAEATQAAASQRIKDIASGKFKPEVAAPAVPSPPVPPVPSALPLSSAPGKAGNKISFTQGDEKTGEGRNITFTLGGDNDTADTVKIDGAIGKTRIKGDVEISAPEKSQLQINGVAVSATPPVSPIPPISPAPPAVPAPPLTPEMRDDIRQKVASDVKRLGIGSALTMMFIPLFIVLLIAKFYIGRSRRAIEIATIKTIEADSANMNRQIVEAKLMALQAQVEPHFLYNTLANVQALIEVDPPLANKMTGHLIEYLRAALPKMRENISSVGQEIELVTAYLNILKIRMGDRLQFSVDVPADLLALPFPPLMLPSLVENAIKHGLEPERTGGRIDVTAVKVGDGDNMKIRMMVVDTGRGLTDTPIQSGGGVGLTNIRERLLALFGEAAVLTLESNLPKGAAATIEVPAAGGSLFRNSAASHAAARTPATPVPTKNWGSKTIHVAARTHSVWVNMLMKVFVGIIAVLIVVFAVLLIGLATNMFPLNVGSTKISGIEGMALGTIALIFTFGLLSVLILIVMGIIYGLGFALVGLAVGVPLLILASVFPALAPLILVGGIVYWFWWRKKKKLSNAAATTKIKIS